VRAWGPAAYLFIWDCLGGSVLASLSCPTRLARDDPHSNDGSHATDLGLLPGCNLSEKGSRMSKIRCGLAGTHELQAFAIHLRIDSIRKSANVCDGGPRGE
jgi:hypothetical protein